MQTSDIKDTNFGPFVTPQTTYVFEKIPQTIDAKLMQLCGIE